MEKATGGRISSCWSLCVNTPSSGALSKKPTDLIDQRSVVILAVVIIKRIEASFDEHGEVDVELHIVCIFRFQTVNIFPDRRIHEVRENMRLGTGEQKLDQIDLRKEGRCDFPCEYIRLFQSIFRSGNTV